MNIVWRETKFEMTSENKKTLRGAVMWEWHFAGEPNWGLKETLGICLYVDNEIKAEGLNPAPKFRQAWESYNREYLINWVQGCHFPWLNPR